MFVDIATLHIKAGDGGNGCISFRREAHVPHGGPNGGDGGKGGDIIVAVDPNMNTLRDHRYRRRYEAKRGQHGQGSDKFGKAGEDTIIWVPQGTVVRHAETHEILADLTTPDARCVIAKGGKGGLGNARFATANNRVPRKATPGKPGEELDIILELKTIADVGLVGHPNAGKSTLLSRLSSARPKVAAYPFTTLVPNLGYVTLDGVQSFVMADIPGLIEGAHEGKGLGLDFLRHIERTKLLIYVIDGSTEDPQADFNILQTELREYRPELLARPALIALNKMDILPADYAPPDFGNLPVFPISAVTGHGTKPMLYEIIRQLNSIPPASETA